MSQTISDFIQHIEDNIYRQELVYRSILVAKNEKECMLIKIKLERNDHSAVIIDGIYDNIDYNYIDNRIVIIEEGKFNLFIDNLHNNNGGILNSSYNFIAFSYNIDNNKVDEMITSYINKTNNNANNTIIMDRRYANMMYFKKSLL